MNKVSLSGCVFFVILISVFKLAAQKNPSDSLIQVLSSSKNDTTKVNLLVEIARSFRYRQTDSALNYIEKACSLAEHISFESGIIDACITRGALLADAGRYDEGLKSVKRSIVLLEKKLAEKHDVIDSLLFKKMGSAYNVAGHNTISKGDYNEGLKYSFLALKIRTKLGNKIGMFDTEYNIGNIYSSLNNYEKALEHYNTTLRLASEINVPLYKSLANNVMGYAFLKMGLYDEARRHTTIALQEAQLSGEANIIAEALSTTAELEKKSGHLLDATKFLKKALKIYKEAGLNDLVGDKYAVLGEIYLELKDYHTARLYIDSAIKSTKNSGNILVLKQSYYNLFKLDSIVGNYHSAIKNYQLSVSYGDSILNQESNKKLVQQEMQYKFDYKEDSLKQANFITVTKLAAQKKQSLFYLLGAVLLALLLLFVYLNYNKIRKINLLNKVAYDKEKAALELKGKQEMLEDRLRISRDLHDEIGATLSGINMYGHMAKSNLATGDIASAGNSINIIQLSSEEMVNKLNDIIWFIKPQNESMESVLDKLRNYAGEMAAVKNIEFEFEVHDEVAAVNLPLDIQKNIYLICKEAINNCCKYSHASKLKIGFRKEHSVFTAFVQDNGIGYNPEEIKPGNGIENMYNRAAGINARLKITTAKNEGCIVVLEVDITR